MEIRVESFLEELVLCLLMKPFANYNPIVRRFQENEQADQDDSVVLPIDIGESAQSQLVKHRFCRQYLSCPSNEVSRVIVLTENQIGQ